MIVPVVTRMPSGSGVCVLHSTLEKLALFGCYGLLFFAIFIGTILFAKNIYEETDSFFGSLCIFLFGIAISIMTLAPIIECWNS